MVNDFLMRTFNSIELFFGTTGFRVEAGSGFHEKTGLRF